MLFLFYNLIRQKLQLTKFIMTVLFIKNIVVLKKTSFFTMSQVNIGYPNYWYLNFFYINYFIVVEGKMKYIYADGCNQDFIKLCCSLDEYLNGIVGGEERRVQYIPYNTLEDIHNVVLVYDDNIPVGCASFKFYKSAIAEVKRVFVKKEYRGRGISKQLMSLLEKRAIEKGFCKLILESGEPLVEAMELYHQIGYRIIENYGQYKGLKESICMQKKLLNSSAKWTAVADKKTTDRMQ